MNPSKLEQLIRDLGLGDKMRVVHGAEDTNIMFKCPWHGERNPSCGISANKEIGACFSCGKTFNLIELVAYSKGCSFKSAKDFLDEKYNTNKIEYTRKNIRRRYEEIDETKEERIELPYYKLAIFKSGKIVHEYILQRGFTKETCKLLQFGWDEKRNRVTIPVFWEDGVLCGFIGRSVVEPKLKDGGINPVYVKMYGNEDKYYVYPEMKKSKILYPLHFAGKYIRMCREVNLVEGSLDAAWMIQNGFNNTLAILGSKISKDQIEILKSLGVAKINLFLDNDKAGKDGMEKAYNLMKRDFILYKVTYPEGKNDPQELTSFEIDNMIKTRELYGKRFLQRIK